MTALLIVKKELKELFRDKKNIALNILIPFAIILLMIVGSIIVSVWGSKDTRIIIAVNPDLRKCLNSSSNIYVLQEFSSNKIPSVVKDGKCKLGAIWNKQALFLFCKIVMIKKIH